MPPETTNIFRSSRKIPEIFVRFVTACHKSPHYQISSKSVQWEPRWCMLTDRRAWS